MPIGITGVRYERTHPIVIMNARSRRPPPARCTGPRCTSGSGSESSSRGLGPIPSSSSPACCSGPGWLVHWKMPGCPSEQCRQHFGARMTLFASRVRWHHPVEVSLQNVNSWGQSSKLSDGVARGLDNALSLCREAAAQGHPGATQ